MIVPLYVYPQWWNQRSPWNRSLAETRPGSYVIVNGDSGPPPQRNIDYAQGVAYVHARQMSALGYVDTHYATRPIEVVRDEMRAWFEQGADASGVYDVGSIDSQLDGIFLDQVSNDPTHTDYYAELARSVLDAAPPDRSSVIGNPGWPADTDWQYDLFDGVVLFEGTARNFATLDPPAWYKPEAHGERTALMVHTCSRNTVRAVMEHATAFEPRWLEVTHHAVTDAATPWNRVPGKRYWHTWNSAFET